MADWRGSRPIAYVVMVVVIALQLLIPASRLFTDDRRFGWKMFSEAARPLNMVVVTTDGREIEVDPAEYMAMVRVDVEILRFLPPHLCVVVPDASMVSWDEGSFEC